MTKESRPSSEKLKGLADTSVALVHQMAELLKLRETVRQAEEAAAREQPKIEFYINPTQNLKAADYRANRIMRTARPGRLFMQARW